MRIAKIFITVLMTVLVLSGTDSIAQEEIYRWVDENGVIHFGNQPGNQADAERVEIQKAPENNSPSFSDPVSADTGLPQPSYAQQQRDERAERHRETLERSKKTAHTCDQARLVVAKLEPMPRVLVTYPDGTTKRMDDNERLEKLAEAKEYIAKNCDN